MQEFVALVGMRHTFGTPWRPVEQAGVERVYQELQKLLGILLLDVIRTARSYWSELLVVVEFVLYTTPGPHGYTPRDIDRRWSVPFQNFVSNLLVLGKKAVGRTRSLAQIPAPRTVKGPYQNGDATLHRRSISFGV